MQRYAPCTSRSYDLSRATLKRIKGSYYVGSDPKIGKYTVFKETGFGRVNFTFQSTVDLNLRLHAIGGGKIKSFKSSKFKNSRRTYTVEIRCAYQFQGWYLYIGGVTQPVLNKLRKGQIGHCYDSVIAYGWAM